MQEIWSFPITESDLDLPSQKRVIQLVERNSKELAIMISYYYKSEGALAEQIRIANDPIFSSENIGSVTLVFNLIHFNACLNIHEQAKEEIKIEFQFNPDQVIFKGPYIADRGMDEI